MAYGSPLNREDIRRYYTDIRRGRPPSPEELAELTARYDAIGGSPLAAITTRQAEGLARILTARGRMGEVLPYVGMRHSPPFIADAVAAMAKAEDLDTAVLLALAPHYSTMSVQVYLDQARRTAEEVGLRARLVPIATWHNHPSYIRFLARAVEEARQALAPLAEDEIAYVFTAHSLPQRILDQGDPYPRLLTETALLVQQELSLPNARTAWQSQGRTEDVWLGPDVAETLTRIAEEGFRGVLVVPCGFVADHLEILYDLDIEARGLAAAHGLAFARTPMGNDRPAFLEALADVVEDAWAKANL